MSPRPSAPLSLEFILLGLIIEKPMHGYDLYRELSQLEALSEVWRLKQSLLYALLEKLEAAGFVTSELLPTESHITRREFRPTPDGVAAFQVWIALPVEHPRQVRQEFLAKLYFARKAGRLNALALCATQLENCQEWRSALQNQAASRPPADYKGMVNRYRLHMIQATIHWLRELTREMESNP